MFWNLVSQTKPPVENSFWLISQAIFGLFTNRFLSWNHEIKTVVLTTIKATNRLNFFFTKFGRVPQKWPKKPNLRENLTWSGQTGSHLGMWSPDHVESVKYPRHHSTFFVLYPVHVRMCKKDDICWQRRLNHSRVGGGIALRGVYPARAYITVVVLVLFQMNFIENVSRWVLCDWIVLFFCRLNNS